MRHEDSDAAGAGSLPGADDAEDDVAAGAARSNGTGLPGTSPDSAGPDELRLDEALWDLYRDERPEPPHEDVLSGIRTRVLAAARAESRFRPEADDEVGDESVPLTAVRDLRDDASRWRTWRWGPVAAAVVTALAVLLPLALPASGPERVPPAGSRTEDTEPELVSEGSAQELLRRAATAVRDRRDPRARGGEWLRITQEGYVSETKLFDGAPHTYRQSRMRKIRIPIDPENGGQDGGWSLTQHPLGKPEWIGPAPESGEAPPTLVRTDIGELCDQVTSEKAYCYDAALWYRPSTYRSPGEGRRWLLDRLRNTAIMVATELDPAVFEMTEIRPQDRWDTAGRVLRSGVAPIETRARIYRELARLPGIEVTQRRVRQDGRLGVAIGVRGDGVQREIIINPSTGEFIGTRTVAEAHSDESHIAPGTILESVTVTVSVVRSGTTEAPEATERTTNEVPQKTERTESSRGPG